jgi:hypothetical protein
MAPSLPSLLPSQPALQDSKSFSLFLCLSNPTFTVSTTPEQLRAALDLGKVTSPEQSVRPLHHLIDSTHSILEPPFSYVVSKVRALYGFCTPSQPISDCIRLYPTRERLMMHRKRDHNSQEESLVITWNE